MKAPFETPGQVDGSRIGDAAVNEIGNEHPDEPDVVGDASQSPTVLNE